MPTLMVVGAHPDDSEIGLGGTIYRSQRQGHKVVVVDLTDGEPTPQGNRETRFRERDKASKILGITQRICLELPNRMLQDTEEARRRLAAVMREHKPDVVVTHHGWDSHPDHVAAWDIVRGAVLFSRLVKTDLPHQPWRPGPLYTFLCSHLKKVYEPSFLLALDEEDFAAKMEAILAYESQFKRRHGLDWMREHIRSRERGFGALISAPYAEAIFSEAAVGLEGIFIPIGRGQPNTEG